MGRYVFTQRDLRGLRDLLSAPVVREALRAAIPVRKFDVPGRAAAEEFELPVGVQSRDRPDGVPLTEILAAVRESTPSVAGLAVRGSSILVTHDREPSQAERRRLAALLGDRDKLLGLRPEPDRVVAADGEAELRRVLLDTGSPDDEWMRTFRRWAVAHLIDPGRS